MAPVIDDARTQRAEAQQLRRESARLRLSNRQQLHDAQGAVVRAESACAQLVAKRGAPVPSPWSGLLWSRPDEALDRALLVRVR